MALMQRHFRSGLGKRWWQWRALADRRAGLVADDYEEPTEDPDTPPVGDPEPPVDTPEDPDTDNPEPGVDPDFVHPTRIEITGQKQTVIRTDADPNTWGNAYIATPADGYDYWEIHIAASTPKNATLAVGITNLDMPLNGIPGDLAGTLAYWSTGVIQANDVDTAGFPTFQRGDKLMIARDNDTGNVWFGKNGNWFDETPAVAGDGHQGTATGDGPYYPFVGLYSTGAQASFKFAASKFDYSAPAGFSPLGQTAPVLTLATDAATGFDTADLSVSTTDANGTLYWVVTTSSTAPSAAQVKTGLDHLGAAASDSGSQAVAASGVQNAGATGLTELTAYFAHFMHEDGNGNQSTVVSGDGFTTDSAVAFPVVETQSNARQGTDTTTHVITLPSGVQVGDLLIVAFCIAGAATVSVSSGAGWAVFDQDQYTTGVLSTHAILWKVADGSDALTVGTSAAEQSSHVVTRISGHGGTFTGAGAGQSSQNPNCPAHTPAGGSKKYLWVCTLSGLGARTISAPPSGFTNLKTDAGGASGACTAMAAQQLEASTLDPSTWTTSGSNSYYMRLLAVTPAP